MTPQEQLLNFMEEISEKYWSAGWLMGLERILWRELHSRKILSEGDRLGLVGLFAAADGWWIWDEKVDPSGESYIPVRFISTEEAQQLFKEDEP